MFGGYVTNDLEFDIRKLARDLIKLYIALEEAKHGQPSPKEVRVMRPTPGPSSPGNWLWMNRSIELSQRLQEIAFNAFADLGKKIREEDSGTLPLLDLIALNAQPISELPWAEDFLDELTGQARQLGKWLNPPEPATLAKQPERYVDIDTVVRNLKARGHDVTPRRARDVATHNGFDIGKFMNGKNGYKLTQFLRHYER